MLFINNEKQTESEFVKRIESITGSKLDIDGLKQNPSFSYNEVVSSYDLAKFKRTGRKEPKISQGADILAVFRIYSEVDGEDVEIRYARRSPYPDRKGGQMIFDPKALDIPSEDFGFTRSEIDQALYTLVHPHCFDSPFRESGKTYRYSHNNLTVASKRKGEKVLKLEESLRHAGNISADEVKMFAKGLGIAVDNRLNSDQLRDELKEFAMENPELYHKSMQTESVKFIGMVQDAIDNNLIVAKRVANSTVWEYGKGTSKGVQIVSVPAEIQDSVSYLKTYLGNNMSSHYDSLINLNRDAYSAMRMEDFLQAKKAGVPAKVYEVEADSMNLSHVLDHASAKQYLALCHPTGKQPQIRKVNPFLEAVLSGEITEENIPEVAQNYMAKV